MSDFSNIKIYDKIEKIDFFDQIPENLTYPEVHPLIFKLIKNT